MATAIAGRTAGQVGERLPETAVLPRHVVVLSGALALVAGVTAALTFLVPGVLTGPAVTNGNARGTALVMALVAVPLLAGAMRHAQRGSWRAQLVWLGCLAYLLYNALLLVFLTPVNQLFLLNLATLSLALFATIAFLVASRDWAPPKHVGRMPVRGLAVYCWVVVALNALAWLGVIVPALLAGDPGSLIDGLGVGTNAVHVQDLAFWLPMVTVAAWWLWQRRPLGVLVAGAWLVFGVMESIGIAVDQWFGHRADPASPLASDAVSVGFLVFAAVGLIPLFFIFRRRAGSRSRS